MSRGRYLSTTSPDRARPHFVGTRKPRTTDHQTLNTSLHGAVVTRPESLHPRETNSMSSGGTPLLQSTPRFSIVHRDRVIRIMAEGILKTRELIHYDTSHDERDYNERGQACPENLAQGKMMR